MPPSDLKQRKPWREPVAIMKRVEFWRDVLVTPGVGLRLVARADRELSELRRDLEVWELIHQPKEASS